MGCGVVGILRKSIGASECLDLLINMTEDQANRGHDGCGVLLYGDRADIRRWNGSAAEVPEEVYDDLEENNFSVALSHTRYATKGKLKTENIHPVRATYKGWDVFMVMNGEISYTERWVDDVCDEIDLHGSSNDTANFAGNVAVLCKDKGVERGLKEAYKEAFPFGGFSVLGCVRKGSGESFFFWMRDGIRPLHRVDTEDKIIFTSETKPLTNNGSDLDEIELLPPGGLGFYDLSTLEEKKFDMNRVLKGKCSKGICSFELAYFQEPNSTLNGISMDTIRQRLGGATFSESPSPEDAIVTPVPKSGKSAASGFFQRALRNQDEQKYKEIILRRSDSKVRSFLRFRQDDLAEKLRGKFEFNPEAKNQIIVNIDDSVVRGNVSAFVNSSERRFGAKEVHFRSAWPPIIGPCYSGIDTEREQLLALNFFEPKKIIKDKSRLEKKMEEGYKHGNFGDTQFESMRYLSVEATRKIVEDVTGSCDFCDGCYSGTYNYLCPANVEGSYGYKEWLIEFIRKNNVSIPEQLEESESIKI